MRTLTMRGFRFFIVVIVAIFWSLPQSLIATLPAGAEERAPALRGIDAENVQAESAATRRDNTPTVPEDGPPAEIDQPPVFSSPNREVPPDPGVLSDKSRLTLPVDDFDEDRLRIRTDPAKNLIPVGKERLPPIQLEASYTEALSLREALQAARQSNLPIGISKTEVDESRYRFLGSFANFVPSMSMNYTPQWISSGGTTVRSDPYFITILYPVFLGGGAIFNTLQRRHELKSSRSIYSASINDVLLDAYLKYYDVLLNWALLDLRCKSLEVAALQLSINQDQKTAGLGTSFEVMQAKTLYSLEKQRLVRQEVTLRRAALQLCVTLNKSVMLNLKPAQSEITRQPLVDPKQSPELLTAIAVQNRPELASWEELRLAATNAARAAASPLLPRAAFFTNNSINIGGSGSSIIIPTGGGSASGGITSSAGGGANSSFAGGFILNWLLAGAGIDNAGNVMAAKMRARRAMLQGREELLKISAEVRDAYLDTRANETEIDVTSDAVAAATEQLRMANLRLTHQIGTNLEVIQAERDYIDAVTRRIEAFVDYKKSQAKLLHATGLISVDSLTAEKPQTFQLRRGK